MSGSATRTRLRGGVVVGAAIGLAAWSGHEMRSLHRLDEIRPGAGVTRTGALSDYLPALAATAGDTPVFELAGSSPGGTLLVLGGTHADEPAGYLAALVLVEHCRVAAGRLIVLPRANASGFTHNVAQEGHPQRFSLATLRGSRSFAFGARATNPVHQWPDPQVYTHRPSGQVLSGLETRNLNRAYPGRPDGTLTERIAFAITTLIRQERVDLAVDLHEAAPEYPVVNTIVTHERASELAALTNMALQEEGIEIGLETSPESLRGLSHREWGDTTPALAVLIETTNPAQGRLRGRTDATLVTAGQDHYYARAAERGRLSVPFEATGWPLEVRVGRHLAAISTLASSLGSVMEGHGVELEDVPRYEDVKLAGVGAFLR